MSHSLKATEKTTEDELQDFRATLDKSFRAHQYVEAYKQLRALSAKIVDKDLLKATGIGKLMTTLSNATPPADRGDLGEDAEKMRAIAKEILEAWRKAVQKAKPPVPDGKVAAAAAETEDSPQLSKTASISTEATITRNESEPYIPESLKITTGDDSRNKIVLSFIKYM